MKKLFSSRLPWLAALSLLLNLLASAARGQVPTWAWATSPGSGHSAAATLDAAGNVYITGSFTGTATFGATTLTSAGGQDVFVAKYSSAGMCRWAVGAGGSGDEYGSDLAVDGTGSVYVIGDFKGNATTFGATTLTNTNTGNFNEIFVAKLDSARIWQWAAKAGGTNSDLGRGLVVDGSGNVLVSGAVGWPTARFGSLTVNVPMMMDAFVAKLDPAGIWQWVTSAGGAEMDIAYGLAVDNGGNAFVTGLFRSPVAAFGSLTLTSRGVGDAFVAKLNPAGVWQWAVGAGSSGEDAAQRLKLDAAGSNLYVTGYFDGATATFGSLTLANSGGEDGFVAKLDVAGAWQWATATTGAGSEACFGLALDATGAVMVSGAFTDPITFGATTLTNSGPPNTFDLFVAQLDHNGGWQQAASADGAGSEYGLGLAVTATGTAFLSGSSSGPTVSFGATTLVNAGAPAGGCFLARVNFIPVGLPDVSPNSPGLTLAPNPAHHNVQLNGASALTATLLDALGRTVRTVALSAGATTLDVRGLPAGLYTVRAGAATRRLVVE